MKSYAERESFTDGALQLHQLANRIVACIPHSIGSEEIRCHELARAVAKLLRSELPAGDELHVQDGHFGILEHSWIEYHTAIESAHRCFLLDVYAPGVHPQVLLIDTTVIIRDAIRHVPQGPRDDINEDVIHRIVEAVRPCITR